MKKVSAKNVSSKILSKKSIQIQVDALRKKLTAEHERWMKAEYGKKDELSIWQDVLYWNDDRIGYNDIEEELEELEDELYKKMNKQMVDDEHAKYIAAEYAKLNRQKKA